MSSNVVGLSKDDGGGKMDDVGCGGGGPKSGKGGNKDTINRNEIINQMSSLSLNECGGGGTASPGNNFDLFKQQQQQQQQNKASTNNTTNFGIPVPNRVFVGGIPVDVSECDHG